MLGGRVLEGRVQPTENDNNVFDGLERGVKTTRRVFLAPEAKLVVLVHLVRGDRF